MQTEGNGHRAGRSGGRRPRLQCRSARLVSGLRSTAGGCSSPSSRWISAAASARQRVVARIRDRLNGHPGHSRLPGAGAGPARRRAVRATRNTSSRCGAQTSRCCKAWVPNVQDRVKSHPRRDRRQHRPRARRPAGQRRDRPHGGGTPRRANPGYRQRAQRRVIRSGRFRPSTAPRNQYRVILEADPQYLRDPNDLSQVYVSGSGGTQVPLTSVARVERSHRAAGRQSQGQFPSVTITYNLAPDAKIEDVTAAIEQAVAEMHLPETMHADFAGDIQAFKQAAGAQPLLILAALDRGLYRARRALREPGASADHHLHPAVGRARRAAGALQLSGTELTVIAFIGIILLIGIVKKNGIMLVDFALEGERSAGCRRERAIHEACTGALPADPDDDDGGDARRAAAGDRDRPRLRTAPAARHHHHRRAFGVAGTHALHHAGDLSAARPAAPAARRRAARPRSAASPPPAWRRRNSQTPRYRCWMSGAAASSARASAPHHAAALDDEMPVGDLGQRPDILVDHQDRSPSSLSRARQRQISARISGARPSVASSRIKQARIGHQRAADRQHLLLAAGKLVAHAAAALGQPRKQVVDCASVQPPSLGRGRHQIFAHGKIGENLAAFRHQADAELRDPVGRQAAHVRPLKRIEPARAGGQSHDRAHCGGLAHAVAAHQRHHLARRDRRTRCRTAPG